MSLHENVSRGDGRNVSQRACRVCDTARPIVLFPKMSHGRHSMECQLCTDVGRRKRRAALEDSQKAKAGRAALRKAEAYRP